MNIVMFTLSSGGISEDISKRKPIKIIGNPRQTYYTYKCIKDGIADTCNTMIRMVRNQMEYNALSSSKRRAYQRLRNRMAALKYAKFLKDL